MDGNGDGEEMDLSQFQLDDADDPSPILRRFHRTVDLYTQVRPLLSSSNSAHIHPQTPSSDFRRSDAALESLLALLGHVADLDSPALALPLPLLSQVRRLLHDSPPYPAQVDLDGIYVAKYAAVSEDCRLLVRGIVQLLVQKCNPKEMITSLCEALDILSEAFTSPVYFISLFGSLSKAISLIKRRHFQLVKEVVPIIHNALKITVASDDTEREHSKELITEAVQIAASMKAASHSMDSGSKDDFLALLGLYILGTMAIVTHVKLSLKFSDCTLFMGQLSEFHSVCGLSYFGLITGSDADRITIAVSSDEDDVCTKNFSLLKQGACISVIWASLSNETGQDKESFDSFVQKLRSSQTTRWQAFDMLSSVIGSMDQSWKIKDYTLDFLLHIIDEETVQSCDVEEISCSLINIFNIMQAIQKVMMFALDVALRKKSFLALKKVLGGIPSCHRLDLLMVVIEKSDSPSMVAILLDFAKAEVHTERSRSSKTTLNGDFHAQECDKHPPLSSSALELVELILKPRNGRPPCLPDNSESVLAALNLYRYLLISWSTGHIRSEAHLCKAYSEWLLPLRMLIAGIEAENKNNDSDDSEALMHITSLLNPVELVLYRCIELVEEHLKQVG